MCDAQRDPILIVGAGVFGLSTALALLHRHPSFSPTNPTKPSPTSPPVSKSPPIHILDASPQLPNPAGSSVDSSRIIRPDYASAQYSSLAQHAQRYWRDRSADGWGGQGRYSETGFVLTADDDAEGSGKRYVRSALGNVRDLAAAGLADGGKLEELADVDAIRGATGYTFGQGAEGGCGGGGGAQGVTGYVNWGSGWADAEACVEFALEKLKREDKEGRVVIERGKTVRRLLFTGNDKDTEICGGEAAKPRCTGVELESGEVLRASLVILATGAWTPTLIDLRGRAIATGQILAYMDISEAEQNLLERRPVLMNMSRGMFVIPPRGRELKIARHGFGYRNPKAIPCPSLPPRSDTKRREGGDKAASEIGGFVEVSVPETSISIPHEGEKACRDMLRGVLPGMADRPFSRTRICWYCDTPRGNFLMDYHPDCSNLFLATGGSGHGFKFFPIIGERIVDAVEGCLEPEFRQLWRWNEEAVDGFQTTEDESRGGKKGMNMYEEVGRVC